MRHVIHWYKLKTTILLCRKKNEYFLMHILKKIHVIVYLHITPEKVVMRNGTGEEEWQQEVLQTK